MKNKERPLPVSFAYQLESPIRSGQGWVTIAHLTEGKPIPKTRIVPTHGEDAVQSLTLALWTCVRQELRFLEREAEVWIEGHGELEKIFGDEIQKQAWMDATARCWGYQGESWDAFLS